jgi:hypothetical protein
VTEGSTKEKANSPAIKRKHPELLERWYVKGVLRRAHGYRKRGLVIKGWQEHGRKMSWLILSPCPGRRFCACVGIGQQTNVEVRKRSR